MNSKIKILVGILVVGIILVGGGLVSQKVFKQVEAEFPIDS